MRPLLTLLCLFFCIGVSAQKENNNWCFGTQGGINFNTDPPSTFVSGIYAKESVATISNRYTGDLMFYTDGVKAFDSTHNVMLNGSDMGFAEYTTTAKGSLIVPFVKDTNKFYVFTLEYTFGNPADTNAGAFGYSVVDMTLNGGLGGVIPFEKKVLIDTGFIEGMASVEDDCGNVWILLNRMHSNSIYAYKITPMGIISTPVVSTVSYTTPTICYTQLKVSPDRKKVAVSIPEKYDTTKFIALMEFDYKTGRVTNDIIITDNSYYGIEFSPNSKLLYACGLEGALAQFDISVFNAQVIKSTENTILSGPKYIDIELGPDGNIYCCEGGSWSIDQISNCNVLSPGCIINKNALKLIKGDVGFGYPTNVVYPKNINMNIITNTFEKKICDGQLMLNANPNGKTYLWINGDTSSNISIVDTGTYWVFSFTDDDCTMYVDTFRVKKGADTSTTSTDTVICNDGLLELKSKLDISNASYVWDNMSANKSRTVNSGGTYWVNTKDICHYNTDTFHVKEVQIDLKSTNDTDICKNTSAILRINQQHDSATYLWSNGSDADSLIVNEEGVYNVSVNYLGCTVSEDIAVSIVRDISIELGADTEICKESSLHLPEYVSGDIESFTWSNGKISDNIKVSHAGSYFVEAKNKCQTVTDSIIINVRNCYLFFPSAFTPNGDGKNDIAKIYGDVSGITEYTLCVYNRWGQLVYSTKDPFNGWSGYFKSIKADIGTYYYKIEMNYLNEPEFMKGSIQLIR